MPRGSLTARAEDACLPGRLAVRKAPGLRSRDVEIHWVRGLVGKDGELILDAVERAEDE